MFLVINEKKTFRTSKIFSIVVCHKIEANKNSVGDYDLMNLFTVALLEKDAF